MATKYQQGHFSPQNPDKYIGKHEPIYRSGWELAFMRMFDNHPNISKWASEAQQIEYMNPFTGKRSRYIPDFFIVYTDKEGKNHAEIIEIKPYKQAEIKEARSKSDKAKVVLNMAKWEAAKQWANKAGIRFRVVTEHEIFHKMKKKKQK